MDRLPPSTAPMPPPPRAPKGAALSVFLVFLRLGLTSFGGPIAHLAYFREEFVNRRQWISERDYADLVALCQFLPGPASSQVGMALGLMRAGQRGALAAWCGFTLPSAVLLIAFALGVSALGDTLPGGALQGLKLAALAVVAQAVWGMGRQFCRGAGALALMGVAAALVLILPGTWTTLAVIALGALAGLTGRVGSPGVQAAPQPAQGSLARSAQTAAWQKVGAAASANPADSLRPRLAMGSLVLFAALLLALPLAARWAQDGAIGTDPAAPWALALAQADAFYRAGALVFGGGHVVLPLLQAEVVAPGWVSSDVFLAGYGAAQAVPGPLFTFAAFLGASMGSGPSGWLGGLWCLTAIFLPSFLLVAGALPYWERLRRQARARAALSGVNATVVGLLLAAGVDPVATSALQGLSDVAIALLAGLALMRWKVAPWAVVLASAALGAAIE